MYISNSDILTEILYYHSKHLNKTDQLLKDLSKTQSSKIILQFISFVHKLQTQIPCSTLLITSIIFFSPKNKKNNYRFLGKKPNILHAQHNIQDLFIYHMFPDKRLVT